MHEPPVLRPASAQESFAERHPFWAPVMDPDMEFAMARMIEVALLFVCGDSAAGLGPVGWVGAVVRVQLNAGCPVYRRSGWALGIEWLNGVRLGGAAP
jgi:hypothetical protein